jgi:hypothetical protein
MAEKSIIKVNKNKPTVVDFDLAIEGIENQKKTTVRLIVEDVLNGCDIAIKATHSKGDTWSVKIPNLKNFTETSYKVSLDVIIDGYHFSPATGHMELVDEPVVKIVSEHTVENDILEEGAMDAPGPGVQVTNNMTGTPEFPIEAKLKTVPGHSEQENIDMDKLLNRAGIQKKTKIKDIAKAVDSHESTQLSAEMDENDAASIAAKIIEDMIPMMKNLPKLTVKGSGIMSRKTKAEKLADPAYVAEAETNSKRVRDILGIK